MTPYWYQLLKEDGTSMGSADAVTLPADSLVFQLRKQVKTENADGLLKGISPAELTVYENKTAYESKQALEEDAAVFGVGGSKKNALVVVVPNPKLQGITVGGGNSTAPVWIVTGSVKNSLKVKGIRLKLYKLSSTFLGYYDGDKPAFCYIRNDDGTLKIRVLFKTEENALNFENCLQNEKNTHNSPMNTIQCEIETEVTSYASGSTFKRIFYHHYDPGETTSPLDTLSQISGATSVLDQSRDIFKYQRLEKDSIFGSHYKADSCHIISAAECRNCPEEYGIYDNDDNNRLALSKDVHAWFDGHQVDVPLFDLKVINSSRRPELEGRYRIDLKITSFDIDAARMLFWRLKEGSVITTELECETFVYVLDKDVFCKCIKWKSQEIQREWVKAYNMASRE